MGATCIVHPLDLIKTRMQLSGGGKTSFTVARDIVARDGFFAVYAGLSGGFLRQATYTTTRLGMYNSMIDAYKERNNGVTPNFSRKCLIGVAAGSIGAFVGTPGELVLIRMTADGALPMEQRRNYKHAGDALIRIIREEGFLNLWRGATPTVVRAMVTNAAQLGTYTQASQMFTGVVPAGIRLHFCASMVSGFVTTITSLPIDIIKTRIQNAAEGTSQLAVVTNILKNEGFFTLWNGFLPYYARVGPHTVLTFIFLEQMNAAYFRYTAASERS